MNFLILILEKLIFLSEFKSFFAFIVFTRDTGKKWNHSRNEIFLKSKCLDTLTKLYKKSGRADNEVEIQENGNGKLKIMITKLFMVWI